MQSPFLEVIRYSQIHCKLPITVELKYAREDNFLGRKVEGYLDSTVCILTQEVGEALCRAQNRLVSEGKFRLHVFDAFRPLRAVADFTRFMTAPVSGIKEMERKQIHYPNVEKKDFASLKYVAASVSNHCFGHTVDLSLAEIESGKLVDMGTCFDFFGPESHPTALPPEIPQEALNNRRVLQRVMEKEGFRVAHTEYWHFEYFRREILEPADFPITV